MARGGKSVCLLERGKERWPGEFPTDDIPAFKELHMTNAATDGLSGRLARFARREGGDPTGLYHLIVGDGQNAFVGNGLGGTSLLNANVFLEADHKVLDLPIWPESLRGHENWTRCESGLILLEHQGPVKADAQVDQITSAHAQSSNRSHILRTSPS